MAQTIEQAARLIANAAQHMSEADAGNRSDLQAEIDTALRIVYDLAVTEALRIADLRYGRP